MSNTSMTPTLEGFEEIATPFRFVEVINMDNSTVLFEQYNESAPVPYTFIAVFFAAIILVTLVSAIGNILVIITFLRAQNLRT